MRIVRKGRSKNIFLIYRTRVCIVLKYDAVQKKYFRPPVTMARGIPIQCVDRLKHYNIIEFVLTPDYKDII